ncbi:hypothetical protein TNCV_1393161 [Trichonephila clavipes]|nr:hypothetical protein TNCV_1393161 [Trichonephila clavipes]
MNHYGIEKCYNAKPGNQNSHCTSTNDKQPLFLTVPRGMPEGGCGLVFHHCRPSTFPGIWYLFLVQHNTDPGWALSRSRLTDGPPRHFEVTTLT